MARIKPTPEQLEGVVARIPEGFIRHSTLAKRFRIHHKATDAVDQALATGRLARDNHLYFDPVRLTSEQAQAYNEWCYPTFPSMNKDGSFPEEPIMSRLQARAQQFADDPVAHRLFDRLAQSDGYARRDELCTEPDNAQRLDELLRDKVLEAHEYYVFDPLRLSLNTMTELVRREQLEPLRAELHDLLTQRPAHTASYRELSDRFGEDTLRNLLSLGGFSQFTVTMKVHPYTADWVRLKDADAKAAHKAAADAVKIKDDAWDTALELCGDIVRPGARDGKSRRMQVVARTYTTTAAAERLGLREATIEAAAANKVLPAFSDPEERTRIPAASIEHAYADITHYEAIAAYEEIKPRELVLVGDVSYPTVRRRLQRAKLNRSGVTWGDVRGKWDLPETLFDFRAVQRSKMDEREAREAAEQAQIDREAAEERRRKQARRERERQERQELRERLLALFPTWTHEHRAEQKVTLHVGPPNSGKTHDALDMLATVERGWYLAPLRLLAYEIFDRLNRRGVFCNLLTGEESITVPGARITAATIEMFNPADSGDLIIIDEAQMLADSDRGWAWTRALMEAQAPQIHVIGPPTARNLIQHMASAGDMPIDVIEHHRLTPIKVADRNWPLQEIPPRTILVAFSRRTVLQLKTELESMKRTVSVVYGNLPPEVRRKQADRFADGETEICIATDAVGMGLNLPADYVCFYEIEKYDGKSIRLLTPTEVHQIGGRAGRFGLSKAGEIGATRKRDLKIIRKLYDEEPQELTHARVAPQVDELEMIPGSLADKLNEWASLQSIPKELRDAVKTADLSERIELAKMLADHEVEQLGLAGAVDLINAPTRQSSRAYWRMCASAIINQQPMPLPDPPPAEISDNDDLEAAEFSISCADIYLWLARRREFGAFGPDEPSVRQMRTGWSMQIDAALLSKLDMSRRCPNCNEPLPLGHRYRLCNRCFFDGNGSNRNYRYR